MSQQQKVNRSGTAIFTDKEGYTNVVYHNTYIVRFNKQEIILNSGHYWAPPTKTRMNQASKEFKLGFKVIQVNCNWYVLSLNNGKKYLRETQFKDNMQLLRNPDSLYEGHLVSEHESENKLIYIYV